MSDRHDPSTDTSDPEPLTIEERARRQFAAALELSGHGGPKPQLNTYLDSVPPSSRSWLREELQSLEKSGNKGTIPENRNSDTRPDSIPVAGQTMDYVPDDLPGVSQSGGTEPIGTV